MIYNTWPTIDGALSRRRAAIVPAPWWSNIFDNTLTVQFDHRMFAYTLFVVALVHAVDVVRTMRGGPALTGALALVSAVTIQACLGILTLLYQTPIALALTHQGMAVIVLSIAVIHAERLTPRAVRDAMPLAAPREQHS